MSGEWEAAGLEDLKFNAGLAVVFFGHPQIEAEVAVDDEDFVSGAPGGGLGQGVV